MMANRRTTKLPMPSASSLGKNRSLSIAPAMMSSTANRIPLSETKANMIPPSSLPPMLTNNVEQTFLSPSLLLPRRLSQPSAYSFDSTHRRVTPMPTHSGGMQCATTPTSNVDVLYSGKSVTTKDNVSTAKIRNTGFPTNVLLAAANATKKPTPLSSFEPSRSRFPHDTLFFPAVVYRMIEDVSKKMDFTLMHWNDAGDKFFIDQNNPILGPTLKRFFNHDRYQSLRRQLNAYGFKKVKEGIEKGYWFHSVLHRRSTFEEMEAFAQKRTKCPDRLHGKSTKRPVVVEKVKDPVNDAPISPYTKTATTEDHKTTAIKESNARKHDPIKGKAKVIKRTSNTKSKVCKVKISKAATPTCDMVEAYEEELLGLAISSITEFELFSMEEVEEEILSKEAPQSSPNDDALSALATVASFLSNAPTPFYSPGDKGVTLPNTRTIHFSPIVADATERVDIVMPTETDDASKLMSEESESLTKALLMVVHAEKENLLVPTPIKLTSNSYVDISGVFDLGMDDVVGIEDDQMSYSLGSFSSPNKPLLPPGDRSAFTPIVSRTDRMIIEMYDSIASNMD